MDNAGFEELCADLAERAAFERLTTADDVTATFLKLREHLQWLDLHLAALVDGISDDDLRARAAAALGERRQLVEEEMYLNLETWCPGLFGGPVSHLAN